MVESRLRRGWHDTHIIQLRIELLPSLCRLLVQPLESLFCAAGSSHLPALMSFFPSHPSRTREMKWINLSVCLAFDKEKTHFSCVWNSHHFAWITFPSWQKSNREFFVSLLKAFHSRHIDKKYMRRSSRTATARSRREREGQIKDENYNNVKFCCV